MPGFIIVGVLLGLLMATQDGCGSQTYRWSWDGTEHALRLGKP